MTERFEVYARACLIVAMIVTPVAFLKSTTGVFAITKLTILWSLMVLCLAIWAIWRLHAGTALPKSRLIRYGACFVAISAIATAFSPYRLIALMGHYLVYGGLVSLEVYFVVAFLVFALYWRRPNDLEDLIKAGATAGFLVTGYQFLQELGLDWQVWRLNGEVAPWEGGSLGNPNFTGGFLGATLPLALYLTVTSKEKAARVAFGVLASLQVVALWLTASRGGLAAALAGSAVFAAAHVRHIPRLIKRRLAIGFGVLLVAAVLAISQAKVDPQVEGAEPTVLGVSISPKALLETRLDFWKTAVSIFSDHPILGTGPDTYYANYPLKRPAENGGDPALQLENNPHNIFLAHAVGSGILGLGAYLLMVCSALVFAFRKIRETSEPQTKLLLVTFTSLLVAYLTQGLVSIDHVPLAMLGWIAIGAIAVLAEPATETAREALAAASAKAGRGKPTVQRRSRRRLTAPVTLICLGALLLLTAGARFLVADSRAKDGLSSTTLTNRILLMRQAFELNPAESQYHNLAATVMHKAAISGRINRQTREQLFRGARAQYLEALGRQPRSLPYLVGIAQLDSAWGQLLDKQHFVTAGQSWRRAIAADPNNYRWHYQYSEMLGASATADNNNRQLRQAQIAELRRTIGIFRDQPQAWQRLANSYRELGDPAQADTTLREFFGDMPPPPAAAPEGAVVASPPAAAAGPSGTSPALGLALAVVVPLLACIAWLRRIFVRTMRREREARGKRKESAPDLLHELIGGAGIWSIAVAVPSAGALLGVEQSRGELRELLLHLIPGVLALVLAFQYAPTPYARDRRLGDLFSIAPFAAFITSLIAFVFHMPELFSGEGVSDAGGVLLHLAPLLAIFALVSLSISRRPRSSPKARPAKAAKESVDIA